MEIELRDYQKECVQAFYNELRNRRRNHLFVLPTGAGKTVVFSTIAKRLNRRTLVLAHRDELLKQAVSKLRMIWKDVDVGVVKGAHQDTQHQIIVASTQTLMNPKRRESLPPLDFIIYDECHHVCSERNSEVLLSLRRPNTIVLGVTATPNRTDQKALGQFFADNPDQGPDYERSMLEMISEGYLCPITGIKGDLIVELDNVTVNAGDYQISSLSKVMNTPVVNKAMVDFWAKHAKDRKTIVFAADVQHSKGLAEEFIQRGIKTEVVTGSLSEKRREALLTDFAENRIQVIVNCNVLTEGFDEPSVSCILFARPTQSTSLYIQMVGRGLRLYPGKRDCMVLDAVKNTRTHKLVNVTDLFPQPKPPAEREAGEQSEPVPEKIFRVGRAWFESQTTQVYSSEFGWEMGNDGNFRLRLIKAEVLLRKNTNGWLPVYTDYKTEQLLYDEPLTIEYAMGIAEQKVRALQFGSFARKDAPWRKRPMTKKQLNELSRYNVPIPVGMTQGEATEMLTELYAQMRGGRR